MSIKYNKPGPRPGVKQFFRNPLSWARLLYVMETRDREQQSVADDLGVSRQAVAQLRNKIIKNSHVSTN